MKQVIYCFRDRTCPKRWLMERVACNLCYCSPSRSRTGTRPGASQTLYIVVLPCLGHHDRAAQWQLRTRLHLGDALTGQSNRFDQHARPCSLGPTRIQWPTAPCALHTCVHSGQTGRRPFVCAVPAANAPAANAPTSHCSSASSAALSHAGSCSLWTQPIAANQQLTST